MSDSGAGLVALEDQWSGVAAVNAAMVEDLVTWCNDRMHRAALEAWVEIGERLVADLWGGDLDAALATTADAHATWRAVKQHPDLQLDRTMLSRSRDLLRMREQLPDHVFTGLRVSVHFVLIPVRDHDVRRDLAMQAFAEGWTVDRARLEASAHTGNTPQPKELRTARRAVGAIERVDVPALIAALPPDEARTELRALDEATLELRRQIKAALAALPRK